MSNFISKGLKKILPFPELLYQTKYMRSMIQSAADVFYCSSLEIMCPNLTSSELEAIVQFLYSGKISSTDEVFANHVYVVLKNIGPV